MNLTPKPSQIRAKMLAVRRREGEEERRVVDILEVGRVDGFWCLRFVLLLESLVGRITTYHPSGDAEQGGYERGSLSCLGNAKCTFDKMNFYA